MEFYQRLEILLKKNEKYLDADGNIIKQKVKDAAEKIDSELIEILISEPEIKKEFFSQIKDVWIFNINHFVTFIDNKNFLNDSYTAFSNRIGLSVNGELLKKRDEVCLVFPYKDCILEGGQTKEESKRNEIFFNKILAKDEINKLLSPKALVNFEKWDEDAVKRGSPKTVNDITEEDNLLIKGNNLLALHCLKRKYAGKIKLIYIDPPYNTGNDSFKYNDNFNHSSWLTFMKNRLEIARELLRDDGVIFIQCDNHEEAYLRVLMDDIFDHNYISTISVKTSSISGVKTSHANKTILKSQDFIICFSKNSTKFNPQYVAKKKWDSHYNLFMEGDHLIPLQEKLKKERIFSSENSLNDFDITNPIHKAFYKKYGDFIFRKSSHLNTKVKQICKTTYKDQIFFYSGDYYLNEDMLQPISKSFKTVLTGQNLSIDIANLLGDFWNDIDFGNTQNQGIVSFSRSKKPEQLLYRIISLSTEPGDIVLDFFLGSGTTAAVAHKMGRHWIGIEQMDYVKDLPVVRLQKVIEGEQSGISKALNWTGGGSFIYSELATYNQRFVEKNRTSAEFNNFVSNLG